MNRMLLSAPLPALIGLLGCLSFAAAAETAGQPTPRAALAAMISRMDRDVGWILALLKQLEVDGRTIVLFTSGNGGYQLPQLHTGKKPLPRSRSITPPMRSAMS